MIPSVPATYLLIAGFAISFAAGWSINGWRWEAKNAAALEAALQERAKKEKEANDKSSELETKLADLHKQNRNLMGRIANETRLDSYRCRLPAGGVQLLTEARSGLHPSGKPHGKLPRP